MSKFGKFIINHTRTCYAEITEINLEIRNQTLEIRNQVRNHSDLKSRTRFCKVSYPSVCVPIRTVLANLVTNIVGLCIHCVSTFRIIDYVVNVQFMECCSTSVYTVYVCKFILCRRIFRVIYGEIT